MVVVASNEREVNVMLHRNVGGIDRVLRVTFGAILFFSGLLLLSGKARLGVAIAVVGLLGLLTGIIRFCVLYIPFGISTARPDEPQMKQGCNCAVSMKEITRRSDSTLPATRGTHSPRR